MNEYQLSEKKRQEVINSLPLHWAFGKEQFDALMKELGLHPKKDLDKLCRGPAGSIILKSDAKMIAEALLKMGEERKAAIENDPTGDGFIYQMFVSELGNTEYGYTGSCEEAIDHLGLTWEEIEADPRLKHGLQKAREKFDVADER